MLIKNDVFFSAASCKKDMGISNKFWPFLFHWGFSKWTRLLCIQHIKNPLISYFNSRFQFWSRCWDLSLIDNSAICWVRPRFVTENSAGIGPDLLNNWVNNVYIFKTQQKSQQRFSAFIFGQHGACAEKLSSHFYRQRKAEFRWVIIGCWERWF